MLFTISDKDKLALIMSNIFLSFIQEAASLTIIDEILVHPDFHKIKAIAKSLNIDLVTCFQEVRSIISLRVNNLN
jgi:hypothetical protein